MKYHNLILIGSSHIAQESIAKITETFTKSQPDIVAVELDSNRLHALLSGERRTLLLKDIRKVGVKGYLFAQIGSWAEHKLGEGVGVSPGEDMVTAVRLATAHKLPVALIDQNIAVTLKEFSLHLTWKEKWRFVWDIMKAVFGPKQEIPFDLRTIPNPKVVRSLTHQVKKRYPNIYKVLVTDRNTFMAKKLAAIMRAEPDKTILAVVGAGHEEDVINLIKKKLRQEGDSTYPL